MNRDLTLNLLALCISASTISFLDKYIVYNYQLQGRKASLSVAGFHGSQDVKRSLGLLTVSSHEKSQTLKTVHFLHGYHKLVDQIEELQ